MESRKLTFRAVFPELRADVPGGGEGKGFPSICQQVVGPPLDIGRVLRGMVPSKGPLLFGSQCLGGETVSD